MSCELHPFYFMYVSKLTLTTPGRTIYEAAFPALARDYRGIPQ